MIRIEITLGLLATIATIALIALYGAREEARMATRARAYEVRSVERGAEMYEQYCETCHGPNASGGKCPPLNQYSGLQGGSVGPGIAWRMEELGLDRTASYEYVYAAIDAGRAVSTRPWRWLGDRTAGPNEKSMAMPAWGQGNGGPLRGDQMRDIANYIVAFEDFVPEDFAEAESWVAQYQEDPNIEKVSMFDESSAQLEPPSEDDPIAYGEYLFSTTKACFSCHAYEPAGSVANSGPPLDGVLATAEERIASGEYDGDAETALAYLRESMLAPDAWVVPEFDDPSIGAMPTLGLEDFEVDALIAFLTGELPEGFEPAMDEEDEAEDADADAENADEGDEGDEASDEDADESEDDEAEDAESDEEDEEESEDEG